MSASEWDLVRHWKHEKQWWDWNGVLARFGNNKFLAHEAVRGAKVRLDKKSQVVSIVSTRIETREPGGAV